MIAPQWREARIARWARAALRAAIPSPRSSGFILLVWGYSIARTDAAHPLQPTDMDGAPHHSSDGDCLRVACGFPVSCRPHEAHPQAPDASCRLRSGPLRTCWSNGDLASLLLFGSLLAWAVWDRIAVKRRGAPIPAPGPGQVGHRRSVDRLRAVGAVHLEAARMADRRRHSRWAPDTDPAPFAIGAKHCIVAAAFR